MIIYGGVCGAAESVDAKKRSFHYFCSFDVRLPGQSGLFITMVHYVHSKEIFNNHSLLL